VTARLATDADASQLARTEKLIPGLLGRGAFLLGFSPDRSAYCDGARSIEF